MIVIQSPFKNVNLMLSEVKNDPWSGARVTNIMSGTFKYLILCLLLLYPFISIAGEPPPDSEGEVKESLSEKNDGEDGGDITTAPKVDNTTTDGSNVTESIESIVLPEVGSAAKEHSSSLAIFFLLFIIILSIFLIHLLLKVKFHYLPESLAMGK